MFIICLGYVHTYAYRFIFGFAGLLASAKYNNKIIWGSVGLHLYEKVIWGFVVYHMYGICAYIRLQVHFWFACLNGKGTGIYIYI